jgi:UDP-glucose 4-epimerase
MAGRRKPRVVLTGATRFLGGAFLEHYADRYEFVVLARSPRPRRAGARADWLRVDLREPLPISRLPRRLDAVVHFASLRTPSPGHGPEELFTVNAGAVASLLDYARRAGARRFVLGSTGGVCGYRPRAIDERTPAAPFDGYTLSKWHGEMVARQQEQLGGVPVAIVRYFFPYGPGQEEGIVPRVAARILSRQPILLHAGGRHPRLNPVFVDDACELTRRALDARTSMTVNCAGPDVDTVKNMALTIGSICGVTPSFEAASGSGVGDMVASNAGARRWLRFEPRVGLRAGLAATLHPR